MIQKQGLRFLPGTNTSSPEEEVFERENQKKNISRIFPSNTPEVGGTWRCRAFQHSIPGLFDCLRWSPRALGQWELVEPDPLGSILLGPRLGPGPTEALDAVALLNMQPISSSVTLKNQVFSGSSPPTPPPSGFVARGTSPGRCAPAPQHRRLDATVETTRGGLRGVKKEWR